MNKIDLEGRRAVITGGAQGIGRAIAERFVASGASVALWDIDKDLAITAAAEIGAEASCRVVDITDPGAVEEAAAAEAAESGGGVDILVCNAGISGLNVPVWDYPIEEWQRIIALDLSAVFYCCRAVVPQMRARGYGRIVNIASIAGKEGNPNAVAYSAAKAGVIALTKSIGKELADTEIRVNCVTPSVAKTAIFEQMTQEHIDMMLSKVPAGRFVRVDEIAALVAWLASEDCSFSTGATFDITGGRATY